jgi:tetratricopeptide (TPR) repeat protein
VDRGSARGGLERPSARRTGRTGATRPTDPAPGSRWGERSHDKSVYDPWDSDDWNDWDDDGDVNFFFGFGFGFTWGWWWWPWWWWWDGWWWPHVHYVPVSTAVYVPYWTPTYVDCAPSSRVEYVSSETAPAEESLVDKQIRLGDLFFRAGRYDASARAYRRALELSPSQASLHFVLADALFAMGDVAGAATEIRLGAEADPSLVTAEVDKREFYGKREDFDRQVAELEKRVAGDPADADAALVLAYNYLFSDRAKQARDLLDTSGAETRPEGAAALLRAEADRRLGR